MKFWDSSAIIPLCVKEPLTDLMLALAREDADLVVWWGSSIECCSSLARLRRDGVITCNQSVALVPDQVVHSHTSLLYLPRYIRTISSIYLLCNKIAIHKRPVHS